MLLFFWFPSAVPLFNLYSCFAGIEGGGILVQRVQLLCRRVLLEQLRRHLALGREHDAVAREDAERRARVRDGLERVLDLVQPALGRKDGRLLVSMR
jgi:hypothetical protein